MAKSKLPRGGKAAVAGRARAAAVPIKTRTPRSKMKNRQVAALPGMGRGRNTGGRIVGGKVQKTYKAGRPGMSNTQLAAQWANNMLSGRGDTSAGGKKG